MLLVVKWIFRESERESETVAYFLSPPKTTALVSAMNLGREGMEGRKERAPKRHEDCSFENIWLVKKGSFR